MESPARVLRRTVRSVGFAGVTATFVAIFEARVALEPARRRELLDRYRRMYFDRVAQMFSIDCIAVPRAMTPARGPRLVVANHRSAIDIALLLRYFGGVMLSRADLAKWPIVGRAAQNAGTIFVDRGEGMKRAGAARTVRRRLAAGDTVSVFPEGTTFRGDEVRTFHAGLFAAAKGLECEVVPVGLAYEPGAEYQEPTFTAHLSNTASRENTRVAMVVGAGMPFEGDARTMATRAHGEVQRLVHQARALLEPT